MLGSVPVLRCANRATCQREHYALSPHMHSEEMVGPTTHLMIKHYESGDLTNALTMAQFLLRTVSQKTDIRWSMTAQQWVGMIWLAKDNPADAERYFKTIIDLIESHGLRTAYPEEYLDALWGYALSQYDQRFYSQFRRIAQQFIESSSTCSCHFQIRRALLEGLIALHERQYGEAIRQFHTLEQYRFVSPFYHVIGLLGEAEAMARAMETKKAVDLLYQADNQVRNSLHGALVAWRGRFPYMLALAHQYNLNWPEAPAPSIDTDPTMLLDPRQAEIVIHTFGSGGCEVFSQVRPNWRASDRSRILLTFLAMHSDGISNDQIRTTAWPGADPIRNNIHQAVSATREYLGNPDLLVFEHGLYTLRATTWLDTAEVDFFYTNTSEKDSPIEQINAYKAALTLYKGDFLAGIENNLWVNNLRAKYRNLAAWICWRIGKLYYESHQLDFAKQYLFKALELNQIFDPAVEQLMRLFDATGERPEGMRYFSEYAAALSSAFSIQPSPSVQNIPKRWMEYPHEVVTAPFGTGAPARLAPPRAPMSSDYARAVQIMRDQSQEATQRLPIKPAFPTTVKTAPPRPLGSRLRHTEH